MSNTNLAYVFLDGNLTADPESRDNPTGKSLATFSVAVNHYSGKGKSDEGEVSFFEIEAWEKLGENCLEYLKKGSKVTIIGLLRQDRWSGTDGKQRSKVKVIAQQVRFDFTSRQEKKAAA